MADPISRSPYATAGLFAVVRLVVNSAHRFVYPFLPAIARGLGVSLERAGLLVSLRWFAGLGTPFVVASVGRGERRRRLIVSGLALFALGAAITAGFGVFAGAVAGFVLMGIAKPMYDIATQAYLADRIPYERRARFLSILELTWAGSLLLGAPAAGWLIDRAGWNAPFWVFAVLAGLAVAPIVGLTDADTVAAGPAAGRLRLDRSAAALLAVTALYTMAAEIMFVVYGAWLEDSFGLSLVALGGTAVVVGVAELLGEGATFAFTDRIGKRRSVMVGLAVSAVGFLALVPSSSQLVPGMAALAVALTGFEFTIVSAIPLATEVHPTARARYLSLLIVATALGRTVGAGLGPVLFSGPGLAVNAITAAVADLAALAILVAWVRES